MEPQRLLILDCGLQIAECFRLPLRIDFNLKSNICNLKSEILSTPTLLGLFFQAQPMTLTTL